MSKIKLFFQQSWLLIAASFAFGLLIAVANAAWQEQIVENERIKFNNIATEIFEQDVNFPPAEPVEFEIELGRGKTKLTEIKKAFSADGKHIGWAFKCEGSGFADKIKLVLAVDSDFEKLVGFGVLASNETPGFGDKIKLDYYRNQFKAVPVGELELVKTGDPGKKDSEIVAITGATVSSDAVVAIINKFLIQVKNHMREKGLIGDGK